MARRKGKKGPSYIHFFSAARHDPSYPSAFKLRCVDTLEEFAAFCAAFMTLPENERYVAFDVETTSLSWEEGEICGFSFCFSLEEAIYVPIAHAIGNNIEPEALEYAAQLLYHAKRVLLFNSRFDLRFCEAQWGWDLDSINHFDVSIPIWLADTNKANPDLEGSAEHFLGWKKGKYESAVGGAQNLSLVNPQKVAEYAGGDALVTLTMFYKLRKIVQDHKVTCNIDNNCIIPVMRMEDTWTPIDYNILKDLERDLTSDLHLTENEVYAGLKQVINLNSPKQVAGALLANGIDTGMTTPTGQMATGDKALEPLKDKYPVCASILKYRQIAKAINTYLENLFRGYNRKVGGNRFSYRLTKVPTGRLAAGGDKKNPYFTDLNIQAITKSKPQMYCPKQVEWGTPGSFAGWKFHPATCKEEEKIEGFKQEKALRRAWKAYPGHYWIHFDYKTQELRIPANLSKEPFLVRSFLDGTDLHKAIAAYIWGEDHATERRPAAKGLNFGALYGGTKYTFAMQIGCSPEEAQVFLDKWWQGMSTLKRWVEESIRKAKRDGYICTYFGRPRRVKFYYGSGSWGLRAFADRTVVNTQVQGAAADLIKIAMCRVYEGLLRKETQGRVYQLSCIHDELNFSIDRDPNYLFDTLIKIQELMEIEVPGWEVPMLVECSIGDSWGNTFPFKLDEASGTWAPNV